MNKMGLHCNQRWLLDKTMQLFCPAGRDRRIPRFGFYRAERQNRVSASQDTSTSELSTGQKAFFIFVLSCREGRKQDRTSELSTGQKAFFIFVLSCREGRKQDRTSELSTGQPLLVSCRTGGVFYFCPVLPRREEAGQDIRAEHRTSAPGVLSCSDARQNEGRKQDSTKNLLLCSPLVHTQTAFLWSFMTKKIYLKLWRLFCVFALLFLVFTISFWTR